MAITGTGLVAFCTHLGPEYVAKMAPVMHLSKATAAVLGRGDITCNELLCWNALGFTGHWCKEEQQHWQELRGVCRGCGVSAAAVFLS